MASCNYIIAFSWIFLTANLCVCTNAFIHLPLSVCMCCFCTLGVMLIHFSFGSVLTPAPNDQDALYVFNNMVFFMLFVILNLPSVFDLIKGGLSLNAAKHIGSLA